MYVCVYIYVYVYTYVYIYIHTYIHVYIGDSDACQSHRKSSITALDHRVGYLIIECQYCLAWVSFKVCIYMCV
jgi:hypothetical protein